MATIDKLKEQFVISGFVELSINETPKSLLWQPDLLYSKGLRLVFCILRPHFIFPKMCLNLWVIPE